jgi:antitoxin component of RelBE/YafQ-DinJ toxin-antitoxin module
MTPATLTRVPNQPKTPQRTVRVPDDVWVKAKAAAEKRGETLSDVIRRALERYAKRG